MPQAGTLPGTQPGLDSAAVARISTTCVHMCSIIEPDTFNIHDLLPCHGNNHQLSYFLSSSTE